jgi:hypothetical protein
MDPRVLSIAHALPGRVRLRLHWLPEAPDEARPLAEALASLPGISEVRVRVRTGSVLCLFDPERLDAGAVAEAARAASGAERVLSTGESPPRLEPVPRLGGSALGRETARLFRDLDSDVLRVTEGRLDLGTLATLGFLSAGAIDIVATRTVPVPPWFNLAWWGFRTFMTLEQRAIRSSRPR